MGITTLFRECHQAFEIRPTTKDIDVDAGYILNFCDRHQDVSREDSINNERPAYPLRYISHWQFMRVCPHLIRRSQGARKENFGTS